jgi:O-antigen/teichoic acid export membrane protein
MSFYKHSGTAFDRREKFFSNIIASFAATFIPLVAGFFITPFIIHRLGDSVYGIWVLSLSLVGFSCMLDLGLSLTVYKRIAEYLVNNQREKIISTSSVVFFLYCIIGFVIMIIFVITGLFFVNSVFNIPADLENDARTAIILLGVGTGICFPLQLFNGTLQALQGYGFRAVVITTLTVLRVISIFFLLANGYGLIFLILTDTAVQLIQCILSYFYTLNKIPYLTIRLSKINRSEIRPLFNFSFQAFILQLSVLVILSCDQIVIGIFLPVAAVTTYIVGLSIYNLIRSFVVTMHTGIIPMASELHAVKNENALKELFLRGSKYLLILSFLLAIPAIVFADVFIGWWMGNGYGESALVLQILLIGLLFNALNLVGTNIFIGMGRIGVYTKIRISSAFLNLLLSVILLQLFGIIGVAMGTTFQFILTEIFLLRHFLSELKITNKKFIDRCILSTIPYALFAGLLLLIYKWYLWWFIDSRPLVAMVLAGVIYMIMFSGSVFVFGFSKEERTEFFLVLNKFIQTQKNNVKLRKPA